MKTLTAASKSALRSKAHNLKPIVLIGEKGFTETVRVEIERALYDHELIKVKVAAADKAEFTVIAEKIATELDAEVVQAIGHIVVLYKKSDKIKHG